MAAISNLDIIKIHDVNNLGNLKGHPNNNAIKKYLNLAKFFLKIRLSKFSIKLQSNLDI